MNRLLQVELTPNGKTLFCFYPSIVQGELLARTLTIMGEPEMICPGEEDPDNIFMLFPHQDISEELRDVAERMTTEHLLENLGYTK